MACQEIQKSLRNVNGDASRQCEFVQWRLINALMKEGKSNSAHFRHETQIAPSCGTTLDSEAP